MSSLLPCPYRPPPFFTRIYYQVCLFGIRNFVRIFLALRRFRSSGTTPTLIKSYPPTSHLKSRIFYPRTYTSSSAPLPLSLSIHAGGFTFGDPSLDDTVNIKTCSDWDVLVISLDYPKSPSVRYPVPTQQLVSTILSILADHSLPFDRHRVAIGGYSAGGQLALSVCQDPQLRGKIHAVVPFYPVTDFTESAAVKNGTRPYRYEGEVDSLSKIVPLSLYAYVSTGHDLREPGLSPAFAQRKQLPEWICAVGAELDSLCNEAGAMMGRMGSKELVKVGETEGLDGQDRDGFEAENGKLKWMMVKGARHGFTHWGASGRDSEDNKDSDEVLRTVGEWLFAGAFKTK